MTPTSVRDIRNLTLLGQSGSGKTTLLERLLAAGAIGAAGSVEKGDTVSDYDPRKKPPATPSTPASPTSNGPATG
jgi:elongation factor G